MMPTGAIKNEQAWFRLGFELDDNLTLFHIGDSPNLKVLQDIVEGYIEYVPSHWLSGSPKRQFSFKGDDFQIVNMIVNEEGKVRDLPFNIRATSRVYPHDRIHGSVVIEARCIGHSKQEVIK